MYFALEKTQNCLLYFKDDVEFTKKKDAVGFIQLEGAVCVLADSQFSFAIISQGRKYIFEAANAATAEHWLEALQNRRECLASITDEPTIDAYSRSCMSCSVSQSISSNLDSQDHSFNYHDYLVKHEPPNLRINCDNRYSEMNPETMPELERINIDNATHLGCARHCHNTTVTDHYFSIPSLEESQIIGGFLYTDINTISTTSTCDALKLDADNFKVRSDVLHTAISLPCNLSCLTDLRKTNNEEKVNERNDDRKDWVCNWLNKEAASDRFFSTHNSYANRASSCSASSEMCSEISLCSENAIPPPTILMCEKAITDELLGLRAITNRQKFRIQELNEEKKALLLENSQLKHSQFVSFMFISKVALLLMNTIQYL
ncbi:hypothetical protein AB6A40_007642 [Gnathostoma spinigerum]|uniref:PH domain-containing protein n=1 Tax=Gnathostoma spinigerum TaxID=75299 RepID=A0ABD6ELT8_9BILA